MVESGVAPGQHGYTDLLCDATVIDFYFGFRVNKIIPDISEWFVLGDNVKVIGEDVASIIQ